MIIHERPEKVCSKCGESKPLDAFHKQKSKKDGHRSHCKECRRARYQGRRQEVLQARKEHHARPGYKAQKREYDRQHHAKHRDRILAQRKEYRAANREEVNRKKRDHDYPNGPTIRWAKWRAENPEKALRISLRRRANITSSHARISTTEIRETKQHGCFFCGSMKDLCLAHDIAIGPTGPTTRANTFCLCRRCNTWMGSVSLAAVLSQLTLEASIHDSV